MPQLNPTPWLLIFIITWITILALLKLLTTLHDPYTPTKNTSSHPSAAWMWTWL